MGKNSPGTRHYQTKGFSIMGVVGEIKMTEPLNHRALSLKPRKKLHQMFKRVNEPKNKPGPGATETLLKLGRLGLGGLDSPFHLNLVWGNTWSCGVKGEGHLGLSDI